MPDTGNFSSRTPMLMALYRHSQDGVTRWRHQSFAALRRLQ